MLVDRSPEKQNQDIYYKELLNIIMKVEEPQDLQSTSRRPRRPRTVVSFVFKGLRTRDAEGESSCLRAGDGCPSSSNQAGEVPSSSAFLFHSGLQLIGRGPQTLKRAVCFTQSSDSYVSLIQKDPEHCLTNFWAPCGPVINIYEALCTVLGTG